MGTASPFFCHSSSLMYYTERKPKNKKQVVPNPNPGNKARVSFFTVESSTVNLMNLSGSWLSLETRLQPT